MINSELEKMNGTAGKSTQKNGMAGGLGTLMNEVLYVL